LTAHHSRLLEHKAVANKTSAYSITPVMAESIAHDVVNEAQSVGGHHQPSDDLASTFNPVSAGNGQAANEDDLPSNSDGASESKAKRDAGDVEDSAVVAAELHTEGQELGEHAAQAIADASGGSDTDNATDTGKEDDGKGHLRTGSVKKPVSFKPVSVTKSFLAKGATASPVPSLVNKGKMDVAVNMKGRTNAL
jgi:hypothetical protein